jgi:hypothetical protein
MEKAKTDKFAFVSEVWKKFAENSAIFYKSMLYQL